MRSIERGLSGEGIISLRAYVMRLCCCLPKGSERKRAKREVIEDKGEARRNKPNSTMNEAGGSRLKSSKSRYQ